MEGARSSANRTLKVVGFGLLAFAITILAGGIWSGLVVANLQSSPAVPWSVPVMALLLWLAWSYLGGRGERPAEIRMQLLQNSGVRDRCREVLAKEIEKRAEGTGHGKNVGHVLLLLLGEEDQTTAISEPSPEYSQ